MTSVISQSWGFREEYNKEKTIKSLISIIMMDFNFMMKQNQFFLTFWSFFPFFPTLMFSDHALEL